MLHSNLAITIGMILSAAVFPYLHAIHADVAENKRVSTENHRLLVENKMLLEINAKLLKLNDGCAK